MVLIRRDNVGGRCTILERDLRVSDLEVYLQILWEELEKEGWSVFWSSPTIHNCIIAYKEEESVAYLPYHKRVPIRRDWFIW